MSTANQTITGATGMGFARPQDVVNDDALTLKKKLVVLESWQTDLLEMQRAEEENMIGTSSKSGQTAKWLAEVTKAIHALRDQ